MSAKDDPAAKPESAPAPAPDPEEDDLDDLDDMLDEFSAAKISSPSSKAPTSPAASGPGRPAASSTTDAPAEPQLPPGFDESEFAKQLQAGMAEMMKELDENPAMAKEFEDMMKQFGGPGAPGVPPSSSDPVASASIPAAKSAPPPQPSTASASASTPAPEDNFQETIRRTMERMRASNASASAASTNPAEDDIMSALLSQLAAGAGEGGSGNGDDAFSSMLLGMMEQLTNKEILYEPMKELDGKFPAWLAERAPGGAKAGTLSDADRARYEEQRTLVGEIVARFEKDGYSDSNTQDREFIVERMQQMQAAGAPPPDLVGDMGAAQEMLGGLDGEGGCPMQ